MMRHPPRSTLFPYTTLSRSHELPQCFVITRQDARHERGLFLRGPRLSRPPRWAVRVGGEGRHGSHSGEDERGGVGADAMMNSRSEEHTSELQSQSISYAVFC